MTMNPSGGLASLVSALQGGMDAGDAMGIVQYLESEQQRRMAQRTERLGGLASLLTQAAGGGMDYAGAQALAQAQPGPAGPAVEQMLSALYPSADQPLSSYTGSPIDTQGGRGGGFMAPENPEVAVPMQADQFSPVYTGNPQAQAEAQMQQLQLQDAQAQASAAAMQPQMDAEWGGLAADLANAKLKGIAPDVAVATALQKNPQLAPIFSSDPSRLQGIVESIFGHGAVQYAGAAAPQVG